MIPPVLQLVGLGLLGAYVLVSVAGRLSPRLGWVWDDPEKAATLGHVVEYTVVPALILAAAATVVARLWDPAAPLDGGWTLAELTVAPASLVLGAGLMALARAAGRRVNLHDPGSLRAWIPLLLLVTAMACIGFGAITLGRTAKRRAPPAAPKRADVDQRPPAAGGGAPRRQIDPMACS